MPWFDETAGEINRDRMEALLDTLIRECRQRFTPRPQRILLLPPDITRMHSGSGWITEYLYRQLAPEATIAVIPTLGQHEPHTPEQNRQMFGEIPQECIRVHDWRDGVDRVGEIKADVVEALSQGKADWSIPIWLNRDLLRDPWDWIIHIGHVVPHEVLGFANHNKNYFIGLGGKELICTSHMMAASCGIENNLGELVTPVRECFNRAENAWLSHLPDVYVQLVMARNPAGRLVHTGVHVGDDLDTYLNAARQSRAQNITILDEPLQKVVCLMQGDEFFSTWVANKAVYRTRMALADEGELIIIAPGLKRFGEQADVDRMIRKYGYAGTDRVLEAYRSDAELQDLAHAAAHLIHGSSERRFRITYAPGHVSREDIESVHFGYLPLEEALQRYPIDRWSEGFHEVDGEEVYFIPTPSAGLWSTGARLGARA